jgi:membrane protease YdiL (CAAX protease family)
MDSAAPGARPLARIVYGPGGLRAGWGILLYLAIMISLIVTASLIHNRVLTHEKQVQAEARRLHPQAPLAPKPDPAAPQSLHVPIEIEGGALTILCVLTWTLSRLERRRFGVYGLGGPHRMGSFAAGAGWGLVAITLLIVTLVGFHLLRFDSRLLYGPKICLWGAAQCLLFFLVAASEEYFFRGYLQFTLTRGLLSLGRRLSPQHARGVAFWLAACLTSTFFGLSHGNNNGETALGMAQLIAFALVCTFALWRTGSLWWPIGFHMMWDWGQSFLYGVPDSGGLWHGRLFATHAMGNTFYSGGTVGPEGSILVLPVLLFPLLVLSFTRVSPPPPMEQDAERLHSTRPAPAL